MPKTVKRKRVSTTSSAGRKRAKTTLSTRIRPSRPKTWITNAALPRTYIAWRNGYQNTYTMTNGNGYTNIQVMLNSCYDPWQTGAGATQAVGYDQMCSNLYDAYKVWKGRYQIFLQGFAAAGGDRVPFVVAAYVSIASTGSTSYRQALCQPGAKMYTMEKRLESTDLDNQKIVISGDFDITHYVMKDEMARTSYNVDPSVEVNLWITVGRIDGSNFDAYDRVRLLGCLWQRAEMTQRGSTAIPSS